MAFARRRGRRGSPGTTRSVRDLEDAALAPGGVGWFDTMRTARRAQYTSVRSCRRSSASDGNHEDSVRPDRQRGASIVMRVMRLGRFVSVVLTLVCAAIARGQAVRGVVVDATDRPVSGVVVTLVDSAWAVSARSLTNDRGEFRLTTTRAGTYRVRTLRIGFRPVVSDPVALVSGGEITQRSVLTSVALRLDTVRVAGQNVCRAFSDSGAATYAVWEQIRTALTAAELTA